MAERGRPFQKGHQKLGGRKSGSRNRWRKADLEKMREHVQTVLDAGPGGVLIAACKACNLLERDPARPRMTVK